MGQLDGWKLTLPADTQSKDLFIYQYTNKDDLASVQRYSLHMLTEKVVQFTLGRKFPLPLPCSPLLRDDMFSDGQHAVVMQPTSG